MKTGDRKLERFPLPRRGNAAKEHKFARWAQGYTWALGALVGTMAGLGILLLFPYVTDGLRYPLGWDAATYVLRAETASEEGLASLGLIRAGSSLLLATLMKAVGQNAYTIVAVIPAVFAAVAALAGAGMVRVALGTGKWWVFVAGFLTWAAFGYNGMINLHLDNLLNAALILAGFAAALAFVVLGKGVAAVAVLFMAAGLAHWPFYGFAMATFCFAIAVFLLPSPFGASSEWKAAFTKTGVPLLSAVAASAAFVGLTFLVPPQSGWAGVRLTPLARVLRLRFLDRLSETYWYYAVPLALGGAAVTVAAPLRSAMPKARRLFTLLMASWALLTVVGGAAQVARVPTAGGRLLQYLFPLPILAGVFVWWASGRVAARRTPLAVAASALIVVGAVGGFGALFGANRSGARSWIDAQGMQQATWSGAYLSQFVPEGPAVFVLGHGRTRATPAWTVVRSALPLEVRERTVPYYGDPDGFLLGVPSQRGPAVPSPEEASAVLVLRAYNPRAFDRVQAGASDRVVAPGVLVPQGPIPGTPLRFPQVPTGNTGIASLIWISFALFAILTVVGGGWALTLLPADSVLRVTLAPALGAATVTLAAVAWERSGLSLAGWLAGGPLVVAGVAGWVSAEARRRRRQSRGVPLHRGESERR